MTRHAENDVPYQVTLYLFPIIHTVFSSGLVNGGAIEARNSMAVDRWIAVAKVKKRVVSAASIFAVTTRGSYRESGLASHVKHHLYTQSVNDSACIDSGDAMAQRSDETKRPPQRRTNTAVVIGAHLQIPKAESFVRVHVMATSKTPKGRHTSTLWKDVVPDEL